MTRRDKIPFWKMHGLGNDFMLIDGRHLSVDVNSLPVAKWADRHTGVGFDQLLWLEQSDKADLFCRIFNSDGSQAKQCGNGMRCVAAYIHAMESAAPNSLCIETAGSTVKTRILADSRIEVTMGMPDLHPGALSLKLSHQQSPTNIFGLSLGNPHVVLQVDQLEDFPVEEIAREITAHPLFVKEGVNIGFMQVLDEHTLSLKTIERGAGKTLACGSNASAAAITGILHFGMISPVTVQLERGFLTVAWEGEHTPVKLTGGAETVFEGFI